MSAGVINVHHLLRAQQTERGAAGVRRLARFLGLPATAPLASVVREMAWDRASADLSRWHRQQPPRIVRPLVLRK